MAAAKLVPPALVVSSENWYLRDKLISATLGAGQRTDAFFVAFRIHNKLLEIIGDGAMSSAVIPV